MRLRLFRALPFGSLMPHELFMLLFALLLCIIAVVGSSLFYFLPIAVAIELFMQARRSQRSDDWACVDDTFFVVIYGFLLSYISYFILPSIGPRFTLHDFFSMSRELPGVWLTDPIRDLL